MINRLVRKSERGDAEPVLTGRQRDLLRLLRDGKDNHSIAQEIGLSVKTIENHLTRLYRQLHVQSRLEAARQVAQHPNLLGLSGQQAAITPGSDDSQELDHVSILVVDDNDRYRWHLQQMIGKVYPQATIFEAENMQTAIHNARRLSPALIFIDVVLGDEDGIQCARRIKAVSPASRIVLI